MFGSQTACPEIGSSLLWWIPVTQEEAQGANFDFGYSMAFRGYIFFEKKNN